MKILLIETDLSRATAGLINALSAFVLFLIWLFKALFWLGIAAIVGVIALFILVLIGAWVVSMLEERKENRKAKT